MRTANVAFRQFRASRLSCLGASVLGLALIAGCGSGNSGGAIGDGGGTGGGGGTNPTVNSVTPNCSPSTISTAQTSSCTAQVNGTGSYSTAVTWSLDPSSAGTGAISATGVFTPSAYLATTTSAKVTACSAQSGYTTVCGSATITISVQPGPTVTSVSVSCSSTSITAGGTSNCTAQVQGTGSFTSTVTWSVSPSSAGTISSSGVFTASSSITSATTVTITAASAQAGSTNVTGSEKVTVNPVGQTPPTVQISASSSTIALGQSVTIQWGSSNANSCTASGAWSGSEPLAGSVTETPSATGTFTYTLGCTNAAGTTSASATVTVTAAPPPNITAISPAEIYCVAECLPVPVTITGNGFAAKQVVNYGSFPSSDTVLQSGTSPTEINLLASYGTPEYSPGFITTKVCANANDTGCGTSQTFLFTGANNYLATCSNGNLVFLDQAQGKPSGQNGYVRVYSSSGSLTSTFFVGGLNHSIACDDKTGLIGVDATVYNEDGSLPGISPGNSVPSGVSQVNAMENGYLGFIEAANNSFTVFDVSGGVGSSPTAYTVTIQSPVAVTAGTHAGETDFYVLSANGSVSIVRASDGYLYPTTVALPGFTPESTVQAANQYAGGWTMAYLGGSGSNANTVAILDSPDKVAYFVNAATQKIEGSAVALTGNNLPAGTPRRIAPDATHNLFVVDYPDTGTTTTRFASVSPTAPATQLPGTSDTLSGVGLQISSDGSKVFSAERGSLHPLTSPIQ